MNRVAHMPAHKALDIDNFNDAGVKVGMYKNRVIAFMHPYTLGALETRLRKMGWTNMTSWGERAYNGIILEPREYWSKDDVTFATDEAAAHQDAIDRDAVQIGDVYHNLYDALAEEVRSITRPELDDESKEAIKATVMKRLDDFRDALASVSMTDVTGELECTRARTWEDTLSAVEKHAKAAKEAIRDLGLRSGSGDRLMDAADKFVDAVKAFKATQQSVGSHESPMFLNYQGVTEGAKLVGQEIVKALDREAARSTRDAAVAGQAILKLMDAGKAAGKRS